MPSLHTHTSHRWHGLRTRVRIKAHYCLEPLSSLENVHGEVDLRACPPGLDTVQSTFQVQPEADLLQSVA